MLNKTLVYFVTTHTMIKLNVQEIPINTQTQTQTHTHTHTCPEGSNLPAKIDRNKAGKLPEEGNFGAASVFMTKKLVSNKRCYVSIYVNKTHRSDRGSSFRRKV
jgi:hypothetical protein